MKKKKLKNLDIRKATVSSLNKDAIKAGLAIRTYYTICGTGPETIYCPTQLCTVLIQCDTYNSQNRCKTVEVDPNTLPIC